MTKFQRGDIISCTIDQHMYNALVCDVDLLTEIYSINIDQSSNSTEPWWSTHWNVTTTDKYYRVVTDIFRGIE